MEKLQTDGVTHNSFWNFKSKYDYVDDWFLMGRTFPIVSVIAIYLLFVLKLGPAYMKNRRPYDLKTVLIFYNGLQVAISFSMFSFSFNLITTYGIFHRNCMPDSKVEEGLFLSAAFYYLLCKLTELMDTVFFVLRKKDNQVTFLHVYHHGVMVWNAWFFLKYDAGSWMHFLYMLNSLVHVIMYAYYGLSAFPSLKKYLWWKKYITSIQLIQFVLLLVHFTSLVLMSECMPLKSTVIYYYSNVLLFFYLFYKFYNTSYTKKAGEKNCTDDIYISKGFAGNIASYVNSLEINKCG